MKNKTIKLIPNQLIAKNNKQIKIEQIDIYKKIRREWKINPKTKILPNKKKKYNISLTKQKIDKIRRGEDLWKNLI